MKTKEEIEAAIEQCDKAQQEDNPKLCPVWPQDDSLYCVDCTCRYGWRWVLETKEFELIFCEECMQMTNHLDGECQKCKSKKEKK